MDLQPNLQIFNGAIHDNTSIFRQSPSPEVEEAWESLSMEGFEVFTVSSSEILRSGKDPTFSVKAPEAWELGNDAYLAQIDVFHLIHCLNELRKEMWYDHYYPYPRTDAHRGHKMHCLHMILQNLVCTADVGIIQHNWVRSELVPEPKVRPMPDFNLVKRCRNFDNLEDWALRHSVPDLHSKWEALRVPPEATIVHGDTYVWGKSAGV